MSGEPESEARRMVPNLDVPTANTSDRPDVSFETRVEEALSRPFEGWDFSWLRDRAPISRSLPWRYPELVSETAAGAERMLDMGTGGGETLLQIPDAPPRRSPTRPSHRMCLWRQRPCARTASRSYRSKGRPTTTARTEFVGGCPTRTGLSTA